MHRQNEYCRYRPTLIIHSGGTVHDYIHTGIVLIELLLHKGHVEHILLLIRCRSGTDNEETEVRSHMLLFVMDIFVVKEIKQVKKSYIGDNFFAKLSEKYMTTANIANISCNKR